MHLLCVWQLARKKGPQMVQTLPPWSSSCNKGGSYIELFKTRPPHSDTECKCSGLSQKMPSLFSIPSSALAGPFPPQHLSFCTNPVLQRRAETTPQGFPQASPEPRRTGFPTPLRPSGSETSSHLQGGERTCPWSHG